MMMMMMMMMTKRWSIDLLAFAAVVIGLCIYPH